MDLAITPIAVGYPLARVARRNASSRQVVRPLPSLSDLQADETTVGPSASIKSSSPLLHSRSSHTSLDYLQRYQAKESVLEAVGVSRGEWYQHEAHPIVQFYRRSQSMERLIEVRPSACVHIDTLTNTADLILEVWYFEPYEPWQQPYDRRRGGWCMGSITQQGCLSTFIQPLPLHHVNLGSFGWSRQESVWERLQSILPCFSD